MNGLHANPPTREELLSTLKKDLSREYPDDVKKKAWETAAETVKKYSDEMVDRWNREIESLLTFAGLFSAILTAFNVQSYQLLQLAPADETVAILMHLSAQISSFVVNQSFVNSTQPEFSASPAARPFRAPLYAIWLNALWFSSLIFSLASATVGIIAKQWLSEHRTVPSGTSHEIARHRQYRLDGLQKWKVSAIISAIPVLLLIALILFLAGLLILLWNLNATVLATVATFAALLFLFIAITTVLPTMVADCRYYSPQARAVLIVYQTLESFVRQGSIIVTTRVFTFWVFVTGRYPSRYSRNSLGWQESRPLYVGAQIRLEEQLDYISSFFTRSVRKPQEAKLATARDAPDGLALDVAAAITAYKSTFTPEDFAAMQVLLIECPDHEISRKLLTQCCKVLTDRWDEDSSKWPEEILARYCSLLRCAVQVSLVVTIPEDKAWTETWQWVAEVIGLVPDTRDATSDVKLPSCYRILQPTEGPELLSSLRTVALVSMSSTYNDPTAQDAWQSILWVIQRASTDLNEEQIKIVIAPAAKRITESGRQLNEVGGVSSRVLNVYIEALCVLIRCLAQLPHKPDLPEESQGMVYVYVVRTLKAFGDLLNIQIWRMICEVLAPYDIPYDKVVNELRRLSKQERFHELILGLIPYLQRGYEEMRNRQTGEVPHWHIKRCEEELDSLKTKLGFIPGQNTRWQFY